MPILAAALVIVAVLVLGLVLLPVTLVQRYRAGTRRQLARGWLATLNVWAFALSTALFVASALVTSFWIPRALDYTLLGLLLGGLLGMAGLWLTRWERAPESLHFTPNRWLVLALLTTVGARLVYGFWRTWETWRLAADGGAWLVSTGAPTALGAGAVVLGYYLTYWSGIRRRFYRHRGGQVERWPSAPAARATSSGGPYAQAASRRSLLPRR